MEEAEAQRGAEEEARRLEAEAERQRVLEEAAVWRRAEDERGRQKAEAKRIAEEEQRRKRAEADARQAEAKSLADEEAKRLADEEERQGRVEAKAHTFLRGSRWRPLAVGLAVVVVLSLGLGYLYFQHTETLQREAELKNELEIKGRAEADALEKRKMEGSKSSPSEQVAPIAQRAVLYDEDPSDPTGKQYVGSVFWRTEPVKALGNQKADVAVRADIEIPDRKFKMTMSFRRNSDSSLPASHTVELTFILPQDFIGGGVNNVPGILMKSREQARGKPLSATAVKVTDGFFLLGLSNVDSERVSNLQLLKESPWFDVPLTYTNRRRALITIEKGPPGERAFNDVFAAWGE